MKRIIAAIAALMLVLGTAALTAKGAYPTDGASSQPAGADQLKSFGPPQIIHATHSDTSPPLRTLKSRPLPPEQMGELKEHENPMLPKNAPPKFAMVDAAVQSHFGPLAMPTPIITFEGYNQQDNYSNNNGLGVLPPDTNGDIGPNHYFQWNNIGIRIFDRSGNTVFGPVNGNTLFDQFTPNCALPFPGGNNGDPIVLYDTMAQRWLASQFKVNQSGTGPSFQCIAISTTSDPTGTYHRYEFPTSPNLFEDYPHFGVWPEAYYMATNEFSSLATFAGAGFFAFDRAKMLTGDTTATMQYYHLDAPYGGFLPSDLDGATLPPAGSPNYFISSEDNAPVDQLRMFKFHADFTLPANTTFVGPILISVASFDSELCTADRGACIPQPNTTQALETLSDRLMYRLAYRNFGTHESLVVNQTVDADGAGLGGVRWYELRSPNTTPVVYQQSTLSPDTNHRWMGSIAQDRQGNMALGYSVSNATNLFPTIRYTGRLVTDPLNQMSQGETTMYPGGGSQTGYARWGDYSMMGIDPVDDCTFWYTQEYYATTSDGEWTTRVGSFKIPSCGAGTPTPTVTGTPPTATNTPTVIATNTPAPITPSATPACVINRQSSNVPLPILDLVTISSTLTIDNGPVISSVEVTNIGIEHAFASDLDVFLVSPSGTRVELFTDICADGDFTASNTGFTLADRGSAMIGTACPPNQGTYKPESSLATLVGQPSSGTWFLEITDDELLITGNLLSWGLRIVSNTSCATGTVVATATSMATSTPGGATATTGATTATATLPPKETLYDQYNQQSLFGSPSFATGSNLLQIADDFLVPAGQTWEINTVSVDGFYDPATAQADSVNVYFYASSVVTTTLPGAPVFTQTNIIPSTGQITGQFQLPLNPPAMIPSGSFWVSVQANHGSGRWLWLNRLPTVPESTKAAAFRHNNNANPACHEWNDRRVCVPGPPDPDQVFSLYGRRFITGGGTATSTVTSTAIPPTQTPGGPTATLVPTSTNTAVVPTSTATAIPPSSTSTRTPTPLIPTPTYTFTSTPSGTPPTATPTLTGTPPTATRTSTSTNTATATLSATSTRTGTATPTGTIPTATYTFTSTPSGTPPTATPTITGTPPTATRTSTSTNTATSTSTRTPTLSPTPTGTATNTSTATATVTGTPPTATNTPTATPTVTATGTFPPVTATGTAVVPSATNTAVVPSATNTPIPPPTQTPGGPTATLIPTSTNTVPVPTPTNIGSVATATPTRTTTPTHTPLPSATSTPCTIGFPDVPPDNIFYTFIRCLACRGIISGYGDGMFRPFNDISRGQIAKMVSNAAGFSEDPGPQIYQDVDGTNPFYQYINRLSNRGHMGGYPCGTVDVEPCIQPDNRPYFRPFVNASRGQLAKIVANAANVGGTPTGVFYTDVEEDNPFYLWIMRLTDIGVMSGYECGEPGEPCDPQNRPYFRPFNNVTRGQASKIVANTFYPDCQTPSR